MQIPFSVNNQALETANTARKLFQNEEVKENIRNSMP